MKTLPPEIGQLDNLETLNLSGTDLTTLPSEIGQLSNLRVLHLHKSSVSLSSLCRIFHNFPKPIILSTEEWATNYDKNKLLITISKQKDLPTEIEQLNNLISLDISFNKLNSLPPEIRNLKSLKRLDIKGNLFSPEYIEQLRKDMPWCEIKIGWR